MLTFYLALSEITKHIYLVFAKIDFFSCFFYISMNILQNFTIHFCHSVELPKSFIH